MDDCTWDCDKCTHESVCYHTHEEGKIFSCNQQIKRDTHKELQMIQALEQCAKEHKDEIVPTFAIRTSDLCTDVARYLKEIL